MGVESEVDVATALTRASRRLQKKATAAPLALSLDRERDPGRKRESEKNERRGRGRHLVSVFWRCLTLC
jgi:hypothetical protein